MATTICYSRSIVHFRFPFQKTIANPVLGHGMIKLLKPPHTAGIWVRALHDPIQELSMTLPRHNPRYLTMATTICYSRSIVHFRFLFQKTIANPVLGHGMIKLLKPPHTPGIWVRALHDPIQELSMTLPRHKPRYPTMATSICFSRSIVHFRYPFQKTIANPVLGHGMIKLLKPPHTTGIWVRALHDPIQELSMTLPRHKPRYPTMATSICFSRSIVHFRYPFQKTIANAVLGHGMIKLPKLPHTAGIWVRALHDSSRRELSLNGTEKKLQKCRTVRESGIYKCEDYIRELLSSATDRNFTDQSACDLSKILQHMESHHPEEDGGLVYLYREILKEENISTMWKIAGYNRPNQAADMLPLKNDSHVTWSGKSVSIIKEISFRKRIGIRFHKWIPGHKRKPDDADLQKLLKQFPEDEWEMELHRGGNGEAYNVDFTGKNGLSRLHGWLFAEMASVEKNLNSIPDGVKPFDFAVVFGGDGLWPSSKDFVIYMRAAGPNVLVGQAWRVGENSERPWSEVVIVKRK